MHWAKVHMLVAWAVHVFVGGQIQDQWTDAGLATPLSGNAMENGSTQFQIERQ